ncbi:hypothetical protein LJC11_05080 [Bacteroidales bacterium OttesenSCG-928-I21]|nr:hypothetical protein [Bacteroidales bacterium OttesenSCG-928-I21]
MKTLELKNRKYTTEKAREQVIDFIESFDFSEFNDLIDIQSRPFNIYFDATGHGCFQEKAIFTLTENGFRIETYDSDMGNTEFNKKWKNVSDVFDGTCTFINFKQLVEAMKDFCNKINEETEKKETEIADFFQFIEDYNNYRETIKVAKELEEKEEKL